MSTNRYIDTRGAVTEPVNFTEAVIDGLAPGGGLFAAGGRLRGALGAASSADGGAAGGDKRGKRDYRGPQPHHLALARPSRIWMPATGMRPSGSGPMLSM